MSPAGKFWMLVLLASVICIGLVSSIWLSVILYITYSIIMFFCFLGDLRSGITEEEADKIARKIQYKYSLFIGLIILISNFNKFINNIFKSKTKEND